MAVVRTITSDNKNTTKLNAQLPRRARELRNRVARNIEVQQRCSHGRVPAAQVKGDSSRSLPMHDATVHRQNHQHHTSQNFCQHVVGHHGGWQPHTRSLVIPITASASHCSQQSTASSTSLCSSTLSRSGLECLSKQVECVNNRLSVGFVTSVQACGRVSGCVSVCARRCHGKRIAKHTKRV